MCLKDTEELNPKFSICNQNAKPFTHIPKIMITLIIKFKFNHKVFSAKLFYFFIVITIAPTIASKRIIDVIISHIG